MALNGFSWTVNTGDIRGALGDGNHEADWGPLSDDHSFALCLTHDVDRPYRTYQAFYYALKERKPSYVFDHLNGHNPYWQFETVMELEDDLGVRSSFNILNEQNLFRDRPIREWVSPENWMLYVGRYSLDDPAIVDVIHRLDEGGWEIGLHGSYESYTDKERLRREKAELEAVLGHPVLGGRQHYLNLEIPRTWRYHAEIGLRYDTSLGSNETYGFQHGYSLYRPFDDEFVLFPMTLMEFTLPDVTTDPERAWRECERLLEEAAENRAVMTILWHPRYFNEEELPNYADIYRRLIERALELDAWVGAPGQLYETLDHPRDAAKRDESAMERNMQMRHTDQQ